jgi:hypothetical protein
MNKSPLAEAELDLLLRAHAPAALADDDFVARTLAAVDRATLAAPPAPAASSREVARALAAARGRAALLVRLRHWGVAGVLAGVLLLAVAMLEAPAGPEIAASVPALLPLWLALVGAAAWLGWRELAAA